MAEEYGGGGHQRVSAISFDPSDLARAREVAAKLTTQLRKK
jgi:nanoRNase/pAp phosphatase (c-di-AMP/oligoRNAs hydrolase)